MSDQLTERGIFRSVEMTSLENAIKLDIWGKETALNRYQYPLDEPDFQRLKKNALILSERIQPVIPSDELFNYGPFVVTNSPESHVGPFKTALDFLVVDGSKVVAARGGKIIEVQEISSTWGPGPQYRDYLNYLTIEHDNGEFSQYAHLKKGSVSGNNVHVGSKVEVGQPIALVGKTGWTDRDHLHFIVFRKKKEEEIANPFGFLGLIPKFE